MPYLFLFIALTLNSLANILLKIGANSSNIAWNKLTFIELIQENIYLIIGIGLFALNVIFYYLALKNIPIVVAYPVMTAMSLLLINSYAFFFLSEKITIPQLVGYFLVIIGLFLIIFFTNEKTLN